MPTVRCLGKRVQADRVRGLRRVRRSELSVGSRLPGHLRDRNGRILIAAGQVLTTAHIESLAARAGGAVYAGPDWPCRAGGPPSPESLTTEEIEGILAQRPALMERSAPRHERHSWRARVTLVLEESTAEGVRQRSVEGVTKDVSVKGLGFVVRQYIHPGTVVRAWLGTGPAGLTVEGVVRYCVRLLGTRHRVGVEFVKVWRDGNLPALRPAAGSEAGLVS